MERKINSEDLRSHLRNGIINFKFIKKDGSERVATGTTLLEEIPTLNHPKGGNSPKGVVSFFDFEKSEWRGVSENSEIFLIED
jgi:hypothetical protein